MIPASSYGKVLERIASHGYVVLGIWTLTALPMTQIHPQWLKDIDYWLQVFIHTAWGQSYKTLNTLGRCKIKSQNCCLSSLHQYILGFIHHQLPHQKKPYDIKVVPKPVPAVSQTNVTSQTQATRRNDTAAIPTNEERGEHLSSKQRIFNRGHSQFIAHTFKILEHWQNCFDSTTSK